MSWWDNADTGNSDSGSSDAGRYDGLSGSELDTAAEDSSAGWGQADYGDQQGSGGFDTAFGWDSPKDVATGMAGSGFSDQDISEALSNAGFGWLDRAPIVGPIDAITQGDLTRALSTAIGAGVARVNPLAGLIGSAADQYQHGQLTGNYGGLGGLLGGLAGSRLGGTIGADIGGTMQSALLGMGIGGLGGRYFGTALAMNPVSAGQSSQVRDISKGGSQVAKAGIQPMVQKYSMAGNTPAPLSAYGLGGFIAQQPSMTYSIGRRFGV